MYTDGLPTVNQIKANMTVYDPVPVIKTVSCHPRRARKILLRQKNIEGFIAISEIRVYGPGLQIANEIIIIRS